MNAHPDDVIKWNHFPRYWPFVRGIDRWLVNFPHKGQWRGALMFSLIWAFNNSWVNNGYPGDLGGHDAHYDVIVMTVCHVLNHCSSLEVVIFISQHNHWLITETGIVNRMRYTLSILAGDNRWGYYCGIHSYSHSRCNTCDDSGILRWRSCSDLT